MKSQFTRLMGVLLIAVLVPGTALANKVHGVFRVVKGEVSVKAGKDGQISKAKIGLKVFPKDTIITGKDSRAKVVMVDSNEINVSPESEIVIQEYEYAPDQNKKNVLLNVIYGKVRSKVNQKYDDQTNRFQVKTPSAVAGVRGTDFFTSFDRGTQSTQLVTFKGEVAFGLPGPNNTILNPVSVTPGLTTTLSPGQPPAEPTPMPASQLAELEQTSDAEVAAKSDNDGRNPANESQEKDKGEEKEKDQDGNKNDDKSKSDQKGEKQDRAEGDNKSGKDQGRTNNADRGQGDEGNKGGGSNAGSGSGTGGKDPVAGGPGGGPGRGPASLGPNSGPAPSGGPIGTPPPVGGPMMGGMLRPEDMAGRAPDQLLIVTPGIDAMMPPPMLPLPDNFQNCDFCRETIESGNRRLIIRVTNGN